MTQLQWVSLLLSLRVRQNVAEKWAPAFAEFVTPEAFSLGKEEMDDFLGQVLHESGMLETIEENLSYSAQRLMVVWPKRFPTIEEAAPYARNPHALAERVYSGRMGNNLPGDGYKYRGRGILQITGKDNYAKVAQALGVDLLENPDLMLQPAISLRAAIAWWERNIPDGIIGNAGLVSRRVNGGTTGLADRENLTAMSQIALASFST